MSIPGSRLSRLPLSSPRMDLKLAAARNKTNADIRRGRGGAEWYDVKDSTDARNALTSPLSTIDRRSDSL